MLQKLLVNSSRFGVWMAEKYKSLSQVKQLLILPVYWMVAIPWSLVHLVAAILYMWIADRKGIMPFKDSVAAFKYGMNNMTDDEFKEQFSELK